MAMRLARLVAAAVACAVLAPADGARATPAADELIVYAAGDNDLYEVSAAGGAPIQLTSGDDLDQLPAWSPDHERIAFTRQAGTGWLRLYTMNATGTDVKRITSGRCDAFAPSWSPSGQRIAFIQDCHYVQRVAVLNLGTSRVRRVTPGWNVAWSPNGRWLAVVDNDRHHLPATYLVHPDGTHRHRLAAASVGRFASPDWSPDGSWVAVQVITRTGGKYKSDIGMVHPNGRGYQRLTAQHAGEDSWPKWSPDGTRLVFVRSAIDSTGHEAYSHLLVLRLADKGVQPLAVADGYMPDW
jgi:Tol biopolymer transport system component